MQEKVGISLKVKYALYYPTLYFVAALGLSLLLGISFLLIDRNPEYYELPFIVILLFRGIQFVRVPYFIISDTELRIFNRFGRTHKKYKYDKIEDFHFEKNNLFVLLNGKSKKSESF